MTSEFMDPPKRKVRQSADQGCAPKTPTKKPREIFLSQHLQGPELNTVDFVHVGQPVPLGSTTLEDRALEQLLLYAAPQSYED